MSIMLASTDSLQVVLDAAPATNQLPINASYVDQGGSGGNLPSVTTGVTAVTIVGSPSAGTERLVSQISIPNVDTVTRKVTVNLVRSSVSREICSFSLGPGSHLFYDGQWRVNDANGNFLCNVTVTGGTLTANQGTAAALSGAWPVEVTDGTNVLGTITHPINTNAIQSGTWNVNASQSGTWTVSASASNFGINLAQLDGIALGAPSNYGTSPGAVAVQGVNAFITNTPSVSQSGTWTVQPGNTANTTAWLVTGTGGVFPSSQSGAWTMTSNQGTSPWTIQGDSASGASNAGNPVKVGAVFNTTQPTVTTGQTVDAQATARGARIVATGVDTFNVTVNTALPVGSNTIGNVNAIQSGSWSVTNNQGAGNWNDNIAAWGGTSTSLGQKTSASSVPVVIASDQSQITVVGKPSFVGSSLVSGTTPVAILSSSRIAIYGVSVFSDNAILAAGSTTLTVKDGSGTTVLNLTLPAGATSGLNGTVVTFDGLNVPLNNAGSSPMLALTNALTSGTYIVYLASA